jgi:hypothetical protein
MRIGVKSLFLKNGSLKIGDFLNNARSVLAGSARLFLLGFIELLSAPIPDLPLIQPSHTDTAFLLYLLERALHDPSPIFIESIRTHFGVD